ncbi:MAG: hypothetical protein ABL995_00940 [Bryobacteraceae bacterium]
MRALWLISAFIEVCGLAHATTLEQLPLPEMARQSTAIVRAKVLAASGVRKGSDVFTLYRLDVAENWKQASDKSSTRTLNVAVPGGVAGGLRQMVAGAPQLRPGGDYLLFLWTGRSGVTQVIGLSQGLFGVGLNSQGEWMASRAAASETMLDATGRPVKDEAISLKLSDLKAQVSRALQEAK